MGGSNDCLVEEVMLSFTSSIPPPLSNCSHALFHSKILGNGPVGADGATEKRIRITTNTAYKLMMRQGLQEEQADQVRGQ